MKIASLKNDLKYHVDRPSVQLLLETENTKEIRIVMKKGQLMKEHMTPFPIVIEIFKGNIDFGVDGQVKNLKKGDIIALKGHVAHDLKSNKDSIIRLSLSKQDDVARVEGIVE
ncbi:MAG: cupin [Cyclobacteriaceae bacterium]|nr:cupin [Cyclobacteriaceae bacterium]